MAGKVWEFFGYRSDDHSATAIAAAEMDRRGEVIERLEAVIARKNEVLAMALDRIGIASRELTETHRVVLRGKVWGQTAMEAMRREIAA